LGFTGTAYIDNDYFNDVIYRFSLRSSIENNFVKNINYVVENEDYNEHEKFQKILQNHKRNKDTYSKIKPLTIMVTKDIKTAKQLKTHLVEFLAERGEGSEKYISENKVLLVTSDKDHKANVLKLSYVDDNKEPVEWIISVAMLTEGWDVKNVFQIVPMEEKAFNSKLLIAQVLGRGLRIPPEYPNKTEVIVFNHDKWSVRIKDLVEEILEMEARIKNSPLLSGERAKYHFHIYNINYEKTNKEIPNKDTKVFNYKDHINLLASETFVHESAVKYFRIGDKEYNIKYEIEKEKFSVSEIVDKIYDDFRTRLLEGKILKLNKNEYTCDNLPDKQAIEKLIHDSMEKVGLKGDYLGRKNRKAIFSAFGTLLRKKPRSIQLIREFKSLEKKETKDREHESVSVLGLRNDTAIFFTSDYENEIVLKDSLIAFNEIKADESMPPGAFAGDANKSLFKTPVDLVFSTGGPERNFIFELIKKKNADCIASWLKSKSQGFYSIAYSYTKGSHTNTVSFNPDFFILLKQDDFEYISVVEIKSDNDDSDENRQKYIYAREHFNALNDRLEKENIPQKYYFNFLSPSNYADYFAYLQDGRLIQGLYQSELDISLAADND
jgi:type III restriction enzyme